MRQSQVEKRAVGRKLFRFSNTRANVSCFKSSPRCGSPVMRAQRRRIGSSHRSTSRAKARGSSCAWTRLIACSSVIEKRDDKKVILLMACLESGLLPAISFKRRSSSTSPPWSFTSPFGYTPGALIFVGTFSFSPAVPKRATLTGRISPGLGANRWLPQGRARCGGARQSSTFQRKTESASDSIEPNRAVDRQDGAEGAWAGLLDRRAGFGRVTRCHLGRAFHR